MDDFRPSDLGATRTPNRNLLRIKVPVTVTLASKKQAVGTIVDLAPGIILRFNKKCDENLDLEVGTTRIAQGECVNVGGQLGLRLTASIRSGGRRGE
jgi:flagellar motor switch/type III secretory pathway protein FliN